MQCQPSIPRTVLVLFSGRLQGMELNKLVPDASAYWEGLVLRNKALGMDYIWREGSAGERALPRVLHQGASLNKFTCITLFQSCRWVLCCQEFRAGGTQSCLVLLLTGVGWFLYSAADMKVCKRGSLCCNHLRCVFLYVVLFIASLSGKDMQKKFSWLNLIIR